MKRIATTTTAILALAGLGILAGGLSAPASAAGALVSSPVKGKYYFMTHRPSPGVAADLAMSDCAQHYGGGCRLLKAYGNACLAIAHGGGHSGWAVKASMGDAEGWALGQCQKYGVACHVDVARCD